MAVQPRRSSISGFTIPKRNGSCSSMDLLSKVVFPSRQRATTHLRNHIPCLRPKLPSSAEEGWPRHQEKYREAPFMERTGWCWSMLQEIKLLVNTTVTA